MCKNCKHTFCWYCLQNLDVSSPWKGLVITFAVSVPLSEPAAQSFPLAMGPLTILQKEFFFFFEIPWAQLVLPNLPVLLLPSLFLWPLLTSSSPLFLLVSWALDSIIVSASRAPCCRVTAHPRCYFRHHETSVCRHSFQTYFCLKCFWDIFVL